MMKLIVDENLLSFKVLEQKIFDYVCELGRQITQQILEAYDTELAESYDVQSVPTLLLFDKGSEKARQSGAVRKPQLVEWIEENLK